MQLTRFTDYSVRVLIFLGAHPDRLCTISEAAEAYRISANHLLQDFLGSWVSGRFALARGAQISIKSIARERAVR
jgi:Rrf2 family nitric oxide-sensitive transcriptional repressor